MPSHGRHQPCKTEGLQHVRVSGHQRVDQGHCGCHYLDMHTCVKHKLQGTNRSLSQPGCAVSVLA